MAPRANIISVKVIDGSGSGRVGNVIAALEWVVANKEKYNIQVANMSLGGTVLQSWRDDPLCQAVENAHRAGISVVASAGNRGKHGITRPGNCPFAITVGALNTKGTPTRSDDVMATYSSWGPTPFDHSIKPDLSAPGNKILGLAAPGSTLVKNHPELVVEADGRRRLILSGTSQAAATVAGALPS